jgi:nicotinamidase-related amidase
VSDAANDPPDPPDPRSPATDSPELALDPRRTALVLIDLQPGVVRLPTAPRTPAEVVEAARRLVEGFRAAGALVVPVVAVRPERGRVVDPADPERLPVPELGTRPGDPLIVKHTWGAFHDTPLDEELRSRGVDTIVLAGIATNMGVESTARAADERDYRLVLVEDAMSGLAAHEHEFAVTSIFPRLGTVTSVAEVLAVLGSDGRR